MKTAASSQFQGDSDPASTNPIKNGKRGAEKAQLVGSKKQKIDNGDMELALHIDEEQTKVEIPTSINSEATTQDARNSSESEEKGGADDNSKKAEDQHEETPNKNIEVPPTINLKEATQDAEGANIFDENEEEEINDGSKKDHQDLEAPKKSDVEMFDASTVKKTPHIHVSSLDTGSKTVLMDNLSFSIKEDDVRSFFKSVGEVAEVHFDIKEDHFAGHGHIEFATAEAAKEALKLNNEIILDHPVRLSLATEMTKHQTTTPHTAGSKTLRLGNLSYAIEEDDVKDFFKDVGEIAEIHFAIRDDRFLGYAHVKFTTAEAAQEALKLNNEVILDRRVKLDFARPRGVYTRGNSIEKSYTNQRGGKTVYVRGFDYSDGFDKIRSALEKNFGKCGEISRMSIPKDYESGDPRGVAFIEFADSNGFSQALGLHGFETGGRRLIVEEAKKLKGDCREGSGYGGGCGSGNGSGGLWVRENGSSRQSGFDGGQCSKSGSGADWRSKSGSGADWRSESGSGSGWHRESGSGSDWRRESGSGSDWHKESGPGSDWRRESGSSSTSWHRKSGYDSVSGRETSFGSSSGRGSVSNSILGRGGGSNSILGRGGGSNSILGRGRGFNSGSSSTHWHRETGYNSGSARETSFGSSSGRGSGSGRGRGFNRGSSSTHWHRESGPARETSFGSSWHRDRISGPAENLSGAGGWGNGSNGSGFSSDRMTRFSRSRGGRP